MVKKNSDKFSEKRHSKLIDKYDRAKYKNVAGKKNSKMARITDQIREERSKPPHPKMVDTLDEDYKNRNRPL